MVKADVESWNSLVNPEELKNQKSPTDKIDTNYSGSLPIWQLLTYTAYDMPRIYIISGNIFEAITDFTKSKISDLIIERDNYKNRLEEVQEAFRWTEMLRATKYDQLNRGSLHLRMLRRKSLIKYLALGRNGLKKKSSVEAFFKPLFGTSSSNTLVKPSAEPKTEPAETIKRYRCVVGKVRKLSGSNIRSI